MRKPLLVICEQVAFFREVIGQLGLSFKIAIITRDIKEEESVEAIVVFGNKSLFPNAINAANKVPVVLVHIGFNPPANQEKLRMLEPMQADLKKIQEALAMMGY